MSPVSLRCGGTCVPCGTPPLSVRRSRKVGFLVVPVDRFGLSHGWGLATPRSCRAVPAVCRYMRPGWPCPVGCVPSPLLWPSDPGPASDPFAPTRALYAPVLPCENLWRTTRNSLPPHPGGWVLLTAPVWMVVWYLYLPPDLVPGSPLCMRFTREGFFQAACG